MTHQPVRGKGGSSRTIAQRIARWRVGLGFIFGGVALWQAEPTWTTLAYGTGVAIIGEALRIWAAGHVEKSREVTRSGPYRFTRHPLYLGSTVIGLGVAIASGSLVVMVLVTIYLATTIPAAILAEEAHLRQKFGGAYDAYASNAAAPMLRAFSLSRARTNREHHTLGGLLLALVVLALKVQLSIR
jgi:protein-S-isoprenylcysteine O-methyltransferase Ste14